LSDADFELTARVLKVDESLGIVLGWGIVCTEGGEPYVDLQDDHVPEQSMLRASVGFAESARVAKQMHTGDPIGTVLFVFPMTADIAKAFEFQVPRTGMMIGMRPSTPEVLAKFHSGDYRGFSIGGRGKRRRKEPARA